MNNLLDEIAEIIAPIAECEVEDVTPDVDLPNTLEVDSLRGLEIMVMIERKYKVKLPEERLQEMTTPRSIARMIEEELKPVS
jgi:acyl carrier protein